MALQEHVSVSAGLSAPDQKNAFGKGRSFRVRNIDGVLQINAPAPIVAVEVTRLTILNRSKIWTRLDSNRVSSPRLLR
jgi:hypothetical protein